MATYPSEKLGQYSAREVLRQRRATPVRFAENELLYRQWTERGGDEVLTLDVRC